MENVKDISTLMEEASEGEIIELIIEFRGEKKGLMGKYIPSNRILHSDEDQTVYEFDFDSKKVSIVDEEGNSHPLGGMVCGYRQV